MHIQQGAAGVEGIVTTHRARPYGSQKPPRLRGPGKNLATERARM